MVYLIDDGTERSTNRSSTRLTGNLLTVSFCFRLQFVSAGILLYICLQHSSTSTDIESNQQRYQGPQQKYRDFVSPYNQPESLSDSGIVKLKSSDSMKHIGTLHTWFTDRINRQRRQVEGIVDQERPGGQDPICDEFIKSVELKLPKDPASLRNGFFGVPSIQKPNVEYSFQTPRFPNLFPHDVECIKVISATSQQHRILLNFRQLFELESEPHCTMDFIEIRDGAFGFSPLIGRFCSKALIDIGRGLESSGPYMWLRFRSDSTIAHRGFQAVYRFILTGPPSLPKSVYRYIRRFDLTPGDVLRLDESFLLDELSLLPHSERTLPIEAVFDVRLNSDAYILLHVEQVQVPPAFAWTCLPDQPSTFLPRTRCISESSNVFAPKKALTTRPGETDKLKKLTIHDPSSLIDGRRTYFEVYSHKTISQYAPPCPKVRRFCDKTVGISNAEAGKEYDRDILKQRRMVIRLVTASPFQQPSLLGDRIHQRSVLGEEMQSISVSLLENKNISLRRKSRRVGRPTDLHSMPTFEFHVTALARSNKTAAYPCGEGWMACDADTCIPKSLWCDKTVNCPQWQDEGSACEVIDPDAVGPDGQRLADVGKSSYELRKEQEAREQEAERLAAFKLHLSILASLGIMLLAITATCVGLTLRRRHKERANQANKTRATVVSLKAAENSRSNNKINHVMSDGALLDDMTQKTVSGSRPVFSLPHTNSMQEHEQLVAKQRTDKIQSSKFESNQHIDNDGNDWNSTESIDAPLLWQRQEGNLLASAKMINLQWNKYALSDQHPIVCSGTPSKRFHNQSIRGRGSVQIGKTHFFPLRSKRSQVRPTEESVEPNHTMLSLKTFPSRLPEARKSQTSADRTPQQRLASKTDALSYDSSPVLHNLPQKFRIPEMDKPGIKHARSDIESVHGSPTNLPKWVAGSAETHDVDTNEETIGKAHTVTKEIATPTSWNPTEQNTTGASQHQHLPNCRLTSRTQSWGGCLRTAGIEIIERRKQTPVLPNSYHSYFQSSLHALDDETNGDSRLQPMVPYDFYKGGTADRNLIPLTSGMVTKVAAVGRSKSYINLPNVNATFIRSVETAPTEEKWEVGVANYQPTSNRDLKPPSAKRPRIAKSAVVLSHNTGDLQWIPTRFVVLDNEEEFSMTSAIMDTSCSTVNDSHYIVNKHIKPKHEILRVVKLTNSPQKVRSNKLFREQVKPTLLHGMRLRQSTNSDEDCDDNENYGTPTQVIESDTQEGSSSSRQSQLDDDSKVDYGSESETETNRLQTYHTVRDGGPHATTSRLVFQDNHHTPQDYSKPVASDFPISWTSSMEPQCRSNALESYRQSSSTVPISRNLVVYARQHGMTDESIDVGNSAQVAQERYIYEYET